MRSEQPSKTLSAISDTVAGMVTEVSPAHELSSAVSFVTEKFKFKSSKVAEEDNVRVVSPSAKAQPIRETVPGVSPLGIERISYVKFPTVKVVPAPITVTEQVADLPLLLVAVMVAVPALFAVTTPSATVATVASLEVQVMVLSVVFSGVNVTVKVTVLPTSTVACDGSREMLSTGTITVTVQVADLPLAVVAVMVAVPAATAFTLPVLSTVATAASLEVQVTVLSVASSGETVGVKVSEQPTARLSSSLLSDIPVTGIVTVTEQVADSPFEVVAVIVAVPALTAVTIPSEDTDAIVASLEVHLTDLSVALSGVIVAVRVTVLSTSTVASDLSREMSVTGITTLTLPVASGADTS